MNLRNECYDNNMRINKVLFYILLVISIGSVISIFIPILAIAPIPVLSHISSFFILAARSFKEYIYGIIGVLIIVFTMVGAISVLKKKLIFPILTLLYFVCEILYVIYLLANNLHSGLIDQYSWFAYFPSMLLGDISIIIMFVMYFSKLYKEKHLKRPDELCQENATER